MRYLRAYLVGTFLTLFLVTHGQRIPNEIENIDYLVTFGGNAPASWGDDDHIQIFFFLIPNEFTEPIYLRVFDPDVGGTIDEIKGEWNSAHRISIFGGEGAHSHPDARKVDPVGEFKSGNLLASKVFRDNPEFDGKWYTFGPFNPVEGEEDPEIPNGRIFKVIMEGLQGDDGNLYQYFLSADPDVNEEVEGSNAFTYEYSFRLPVASGEISHIYPFIDKNVVSITQHNFDFDYDGELVIYSVSKNRHKVKKSADLKWASSMHEITPEEQNTTIEIQIIKQGKPNNNMVFFLRNQYEEVIRFYSIPIGGPPRYKYQVNLKYYQKDED
ncbi:hypothetical protein AAOE16_01375 [Ekhidna sp. MALMAid0563]|uniref:hypothetical protein n=1 Tax=Ekhidna sp. MALMAid0563 TaxID=3143937 RepID=UPI0032DF7017